MERADDLFALVEASCAVRDARLDLIEELRDLQEDQLHELALRSSWHHNGFAKIVLRGEVTDRRPLRTTFSMKHRVRLHVWPAGGTTRTAPDPHSHRWPFASAVLAGHGLATVEFVEHPTGPAFNVYEVGPSSPGLRARGQARIRPLESEVHGPDSVYVCTTGTMHSVRPVGQSCVVSAVVTGTPVARSSLVFRDPSRAAEVTSRSLGAEELVTILREATDALATTSA